MMVVLSTGEPLQTLARAGALVAIARQIQLLAANRGTDSPSDIHIVLAGEAPEALARTIAKDIGVPVTAMHLPDTASWDLLGRGLESVADTMGPAMVIFDHTAMAREVGPAMAIALGGVSISNVCGVDREDGRFLFTRPVMDNTRTQAVSVPDRHLSLISLAPGAVVAEGRFGAMAGKQLAASSLPDPQVAVVSPPQSSSVKRICLSSRSGAGDGSLSRAPIVVAAGRGIGNADNLQKVCDFAACFPGAATAASRPLVDQGWVGYDRQVGITGAVVSPELYIALGISGSSQHLAGMAGSKWVVTVNHSPDAPICRHSDLCLQADVTAFMDEVLENRKKR
jgi:electron transfer flavoprotein alpha subunit